MQAKYFLGETEIRIGRSTYVLRPDFHTLYAIEQQTGVPLAHVIAHLDSPSCNPHLVRYILRLGIRAHSGHCPYFIMMTKRGWLRLREQAIVFLLAGLGYVVSTQAHDASCSAPLPTQPQSSDAPYRAAAMAGCDESSTATKARTVRHDTTTLLATIMSERLDWPQLYKLATATHTVAEESFWRMTLCGLLLQCEMQAASAGVAMVLPASPAELQQLMQRYPDTASGTDIAPHHTIHTSF